MSVCYTGSLLLSNLSPLVHLQIFPHCRGWATLKFLVMVCDKVKALSCLKPPWEEGFNEQTGARAVAHMRESVMETPLYTLQIKAKPCKCFSTHFQETGRNGPIHYCSLVSCECLGVNGLKCAPKIVKKKSFLTPSRSRKDVLQRENHWPAAECHIRQERKKIRLEKIW